MFHDSNGQPISHISFLLKEAPFLQSSKVLTTTGSVQVAVLNIKEKSTSPLFQNASHSRTRFHTNNSGPEDLASQRVSMEQYGE